MQPIEINDPAEIEAFLSKIALTGKGFTTDCLLMEVFDAGLEKFVNLNKETFVGRDAVLHQKQSPSAWCFVGFDGGFKFLQT